MALISKPKENQKQSETIRNSENNKKYLFMTLDSVYFALQVRIVLCVVNVCGTNTINAFIF
jgi:hypothetical protein